MYELTVYSLLCLSLLDLLLILTSKQFHIFWKRSYYCATIRHERTVGIYKIYNGLFQRNIVRPCWGYRFFGVDQSILPWPPWKSILFPKIFSYPSPWNSNDLCSTPLEFSIDILNRGITEFFFQENCNKLYLNCTVVLSTEYYTIIFSECLIHYLICLPMNISLIYKT